MQIMRKLIEILAESYLFSCLIAYISLVAVTATKIDLESAVAGSLFFALFFGAFVQLFFSVIDLLLDTDTAHA